MLLKLLYIPIPCILTKVLVLTPLVWGDWKVSIAASLAGARTTL